jgi:hypothetical protein
MDKVQKHNSFNTNTPSSESYRNYKYICNNESFKNGAAFEDVGELEYLGTKIINTNEVPTEIRRPICYRIY